MVDPYPELYAALESFATHGLSLADLLTEETSFLAMKITPHFEALGIVAATLEGMAELDHTLITM